MHFIRERDEDVEYFTVTADSLRDQIGIVKFLTPIPFHPTRFPLFRFLVVCLIYFSGKINFELLLGILVW